MTNFPSFTEFSAALHGFEPFPWQQRLAERVAATGWPEQVGVPTGLGKTSCIDIAVWSLAAQAHKAPADRTLPTRIWYVVNRRLLVDSAYDRTASLSAQLLDPDAPAPIREVAERLNTIAAMGSTHGPLHICRLRGGVGLGSVVPDPSHPTVYFATVPMFASRLLFRGYGTSRTMLPVEAAHAGTDALVLLDEAHLARPLARLCEDLPPNDIGDPVSVLPASRARPTLVALTATGETEPDTFNLDDSDHRNAIISRRLNATKHTRLVTCTAKTKLKTIIDETIALIADDTDIALVVFLNTPLEARTVFAGLQKQLNGQAALELLTGQIRDWDATAIRSRLLDEVTGAPANRPRDTPRPQPLVVVATQTLEVGADLDFDRLVTESAGARAIVQRFGRLNRLGQSPHGQAVICHPTDQDQWPVYGTEPDTVWNRLTDDGTTSERSLAPLDVTAAVGHPADEPPRTGILHQMHLWEWAKTSIRPPNEAPVNLFFEGFDEGVPRVFVVWRAHHPAEGSRLIPAIRSAEAVELSIQRVKEALNARDLDTVARVDHDGGGLEKIPVSGIRPGDQVVLQPQDGLYDEFGWNPLSHHPVSDLSSVIWGGLLLDEEHLKNLVPNDPRTLAVVEIATMLTGLEADSDEEFRQTETELLEALKVELRQAKPFWITDELWAAFVDGLGSTVERPADAVPHIRPARRRDRAHVRHDAFDELSFDVRSVALAEHNHAVGETAMAIGKRIGLPDELCTALRTAGQLHDAGKADRRFQLWLAPRGVEGLIAKSAYPRSLSEGYRRTSGWPRGGRHELLSVRLAAQHLTGREHADLIVHLIHAHHGGGRPTTRIVQDDTGCGRQVSYDFEGQAVTVSAGLDEPDLHQPHRFRSLGERYGLWGLALLEACLKQADHAVSSAIEVI